MRLAAKEESAGKYLACPKCGAKILIPKVAAAVKAAPQKSPAFEFPTARRGEPSKAGVRFALSGGAKLLIGFGIAIPLIIALIRYGPVRAMQQWNQAEPIAESDVTDLVGQALRQRHTKLNMDIRPEAAPKVKYVSIGGPMLPMTMPSSVSVQGSTTEGSFSGTYYPADRSLDARVEDSDGKTVNVKGNVKDNKTTVERCSP
jgi:hypothetical protein